MFPALAGRFFTTSTTWEAQISRFKKKFFLKKKKVKKEKIWESGRGSNRDYSQPSGDYGMSHGEEKAENEDYSFENVGSKRKR